MPLSHIDGVNSSYVSPLPLTIFLFSPHFSSHNFHNNPVHFFINVPLDIPLLLYDPYLLDYLAISRHLSTRPNYLAIHSLTFSRLCSSLPHNSYFVPNSIQPDPHIYVSILISATLIFILFFFCPTPNTQIHTTLLTSQGLYETSLLPLYVLFYHTTLTSLFVISSS